MNPNPATTLNGRAFAQVDVFTATPYKGNPLAVVLDGTGLDTGAMQAFTDWTNLSECTFVLPPTVPEADYRVRIFCPGRELPFAGHPTLGTAHAWLQAGGRPRGEHLVQECGVGLVPIRIDGARLAFAAPPLRRDGPLDEADVALIARGLGVNRREIVAHSWCDNGPGWRAVMLGSAEQVLALRPDPAVLAGLDIGVVGPRGKVGVVGAQGGCRDHRRGAPQPVEEPIPAVEPDEPDPDVPWHLYVDSVLVAEGVATGAQVQVAMTLTTPTGPAGEMIHGGVQAALAGWRA